MGHLYQERIVIGFPRNQMEKQHHVFVELCGYEKMENGTTMTALNVKHLFVNISQVRF